MKPQYAIAKYIPMKVRRQMVAVQYQPNRKPPFTNGYRYPVCRDGKCPMGWLREGFTQPTPELIADELREIGLSSARRVEWWKLVRAARAFVDAWDTGHIKSLHKALGVPK